jgi:hypothetical protein
MDKRILRLALYIGLLGVVSLGLLAHRASAELREQSLGLGRSLDHFADLRGRSTKLTFNGQSFTVSTRVIDAPLASVLERFIERCSADTKQLSSDLARESKVPAAFFQRMLVLRDMPSDQVGTAVCLAGLGEGGLAGLSSRVKAFAGSSDLSELGELRYTYMRRAGAGTHVILVSAAGPMRLHEMFPADRDVAGPDVVAGLRPEASTRILAATAAGTPHVVTAYRVAAAPAAAMSDYATKLEARGFKPVPLPKGYGHPHQATLDDASLTRGYMQGTQALVAMSSPAANGGSTLAVVQLERPLTGDVP